MERIDIQNFNKYYRKNDGNATLARVGHVNAVIEEMNTEFENVEDQITVIESDITSLENRIQEITDNVFADNAAAIVGSLAVGTLYSTPTGEIRIVV
jgi:predicted  nucleic acid-binding Zn-ribbon protein